MLFGTNWLSSTNPATSAAALRLAACLLEEGKTGEAEQRLESLAAECPIQLSAIRPCGSCRNYWSLPARKLPSWRSTRNGLQPCLRQAVCSRFVLALEADDPQGSGGHSLHGGQGQSGDLEICVCSGLR